MTKIHDFVPQRTLRQIRVKGKYPEDDGDYPREIQDLFIQPHVYRMAVQIAAEIAGSLILNEDDTFEQDENGCFLRKPCVDSGDYYLYLELTGKLMNLQDHQLKLVVKSGRVKGEVVVDKETNEIVKYLSDWVTGEPLDEQVAKKS